MHHFLALVQRHGNGKTDQAKEWWKKSTAHTLTRSHAATTFFLFRTTCLAGWWNLLGGWMCHLFHIHATCYTHCNIAWIVVVVVAILAVTVHWSSSIESSVGKREEAKVKGVNQFRGMYEHTPHSSPSFLSLTQRDQQQHQRNHGPSKPNERQKIDSISFSCVPAVRREERV